MKILPVSPVTERGVALLAVLFALTLLILLALPFAVSMGVGADAAMRDVEETSVQEASASVREVLLNEAAMSHPALDATPTYDGLAEYPGGVELPAAFSALNDGGRVLLGGGIVDLQRFLGLDSASPLLFANVLGTATRLHEDLMKGATSMVVDDASALPDAGALWVADELVRYGSKQGNNLLQLERGLLPDQFNDGTQNIRAGVLVLDYRCVLAAAWPFFGRGDATRQKREPFRAVGELAEIAKANFGSFTTAEIETLQRVFAVDTMATTASTWGRSERLFNDLKAGQSRSIDVKSALHLGAGATVRFRNLRTGATEYSLLSSASAKRTPQAVELPTSFELGLLVPVLQDFPAIDTVVEPLIPVPVNVNTASAEVLTALCAEIGIAQLVRLVPAEGNKQTTAPAIVSHGEAVAFAQQIVAVRSVDGPEGGSSAAPNRGPFTGWLDFVTRIWKDRFDQITNDPERGAWIALYRNLQTGRDARIEMGTAPLCFDSGPWVAYRAAASRSRSVVAPGVVGRHERTGVAAAVPGFLLEKRWATQEAFEETFRLDRRAPYWTTTPINLGAIGNPAEDPASRHSAHISPIAYPSNGLGSPRFATTDEVEAGITANPATVVSIDWPRSGGGLPQVHVVELMGRTQDRRGHDVKKDGPYLVTNSGPSGSPGGGAPGRSAPPSQQQQRTRSYTPSGPEPISFPFSNQYGFMDPFGLSAWFQCKDLSDKFLFDHGDGDPDRNRLSLLTRDGSLVLEVIDEAGIDPNPGESPASVQRTATEWSLPLVELGLPTNVPVHVGFSAYTSRPSDLSVAVDGVTRGKVKYRTYLTSSLKPFDPTLSNNRIAPGLPGFDKSERFVDLQVESTDGFPPQGVLRVGLELFEYSSIEGNVFKCRFADSLGGRGARQVGREHFPKIPVDKNGKPTVDINELQQQGVTLDVFPEHPVGSQVELYGYAAVLGEDSPMMVGSTQLTGAIGAFAVARAFLDNPRDITVSLPTGGSFPVGRGIDENWTGDLLLGDPTTTNGINLTPPPGARTEVTDAFCTTGGYALLLQRRLPFDPPLGAGAGSAQVGGIEVIKYTSRNGNKLVGVQRNQTLPGDNKQIRPSLYDGTARKFVCDWQNWQWGAGSGLYWDDIPTLITWVIPVSISVQDTNQLWDPVKTGLSEWVQLYPKGNEVDTEWVRYDSIMDRNKLCRGNRAAWDALYFQLIRTYNEDRIQVGPLGPANPPTADATPPWGNVTATSGFIGYTQRLESDLPQIRASRYALRFRGDPMQDFYADGNSARSDPNPQATTSHPQNGSVVMQCQRMQLGWGNYSSYTGRCGRNDRIAIVGGSQASGSKRPGIEWHTVNWCARRFDDDTPPQGQQVVERLGPDPFQLVAFKDAVRIPTLGPPDKEIILESRHYDRVVKFPSGELPAAWCDKPTVGAGIGNGLPIDGYVDDIDVTNQIVPDAVVDELFDASAKVFRINPAFVVLPAGLAGSGNDLTEVYPKGGGLVMIDGEILAYVSRAQGEFTIATNGRGLLNTEPRGHDRGARVHFLTHRPAAILGNGVGSKDDQLQLVERGPLPRTGTLLLGQELLHYCWPRGGNEQTTLEMPRWFPPSGDRATSQARGLFRGRYGTAAQSGSANAPVILFPFRYWDRYVENSDDPELAYSQLTINESPAFFRTMRWREETSDARCEVVCLVRTDSKVPWESDPQPGAGLWLLRGGNTSTPPHKLSRYGTRLEIRFATKYLSGAIDLSSYRAHGWKTTARIVECAVEYEGQGRIFDEQVTAR